MIGLGRGKVILLGEHAVVHGHPALAGALAGGLVVTARPAAGPPQAGARLVVAAWGLDTAADRGATPARALAALVAALEESLGPLPACDLIGEASIPPRAGLGSSAALAVATARALAAAAGAGPADAPALVERAALAAERVFHGTASGVDVVLAARGGLGLFRRGAGLEPLDAPPLRLAIGLSGEPRDTAARVADVARLRREHPRRTDRLLGELGELALEGAAALGRRDPGALGPLLDRAHERLASLGLSSPGLERLTAAARTAGAAGVKLTGAGGGGAAIAVGPLGAIVEAWRALGLEAFEAEVGAP